MERVGVVTNPKVSEGHLERLLATLEKHGIQVDPLSEPAEERVADTEPDLVFVLGGDGTMLRASRMFPSRVLLGVNLGKVGFMSGILPDDIETGVEKALSGDLHVQEYRMLDARIEGEEEPLLAANDAVLLKPHPRQACSVEVSVGGEELFASSCDGFVVATALGSTAYALSAAGPIISGDARCYTLVAIAPHSLASRPLIVGEEQATELKVGEAGALLSIDGGEPREVPADARVRLRFSRERVRIGRTDKRTWWQAVRRTFL